MRAVSRLTLALLALLWFFALPAHAEPHKHPRLVIVQCDGLTFDDLQSEVTPHLRQLAEANAFGMIQCAELTDASSLKGKRVTLAEILPPSLNEERAGREGGMGGLGKQATRPDAEAPAGVIDDPIRLMQKATETEVDFVLVSPGDLMRADAARSQLSPEQYRAARAAALRRLNLFFFLLTEKLQSEEITMDVLLVSTRPPSETRLPTGAWGRLTPVIAFGPHFPPGLLTSGTTRTLGLVASTDIAPTAYKRLDLPPPVALSGRPIRSVPAYESNAQRFAAVARIDFVAMRNGQAQVRVMVPLGSLCALAVLVSLIVRKRRGVVWGRRLAPVLIFCLNLPAALLLAPLLIPPTLLEYGLRIVAWQAGLTAGCYLLARLLSLSPPVVALLLTTALVVGDIFAGQSLMKDSLLSCGSLYGVRFYGLGNEYLGVLLGMIFTGGFALLDDKKREATDKKRWLLALFWLLLMGLFGWPSLGANAGSLVVMGAGITAGAISLAGKTPRWWQAVLGMAGGLLLAFVFAALDARLNRDGTVSHLGGALQSASGGRGGGYLLEIITRKIGLNLSLLFTVWFLAAIVVVVGILLVARILIGETLRNMLEKRLWTARSLPVMLVVGIAALIFKDTGVVTVTFLVGATCLILFAFAFTEPETAK